MKKLLFLLSILSLFSYGCNKNEDAGTATDTGMQREETRDIETTPEVMDTRDSVIDSDIQGPEMQEEEMRDEYQEEDLNLNEVPATQESGTQQ